MSSSKAQIIESCVTTHLLEYHKLFNEQSKQNIERANHQAMQWKLLHTHENASTTIIPVVVHIVFTKEAENISDAQIQLQIDLINQEYQKAGIEFCLTAVDPHGVTSNGITHTQGYGTLHGIFDFYDPLKQTLKKSTDGGIDAWPTDHYLNIWICNLLPGVEGYAQLPGDDEITDGVVIDYESFSTSNILSHQIAHWLGIDAMDCLNGKIKAGKDFSAEQIATMQSYLFTDKASLLELKNSNCQLLSTNQEYPFVDEKFKIYPNPAGNEITIQLSNSTNNEISIVNAIGEQVLIKKIENSLSTLIDLSSFKPGIYFIKTTVETKSFVKL